MTATTGDGTLAANKDVVRGFVDALNEGRVADFGTYVADDVVDHNKIMFGEPDEPGAAFEALRVSLDAFAPYHMRVEDIIAEGDEVMIRYVQSGVNNGWHARTPVPTGRSFENEGIFVFTVRGGKITEMRGVSDRMTMLTQIGVLPDIG